MTHGYGRHYVAAAALIACVVLPATLNAQQHTGAQHNAAATTPPVNGSLLQSLIAIQERMMADPVIRERVATDPILQRMLQSLAGVPEAQAMMPGMAMPGMAMQGVQSHAGMQMTPATQGMQAHAGMPMGDAQPTLQDQQKALDFIVRLLAVPDVQATIREDDTMRRLWSDAELQQRLSELRARMTRGGSNPERN